MPAKQIRPAVDPRYHTIAELAVRWHVSALHVRRLIWRGDLHAVRFGRVVRVPVGEVERYEAALRPA